MTHQYSISNFVLLATLALAGGALADSGVFRSATLSTVGSRPTALEVGDIDRDGELDVVVTNTGGFSNQIVVAIGRGDSNLIQFPPGLDVGSLPGETALADLNDDGIADLAIANTNDSSVTILAGLGTREFFGDALDTESVGGGPVEIVVGDLNNDDIPDLVTANVESEGSRGTVSVLLGIGNGTFGRVDHDSVMEGVQDLEGEIGTSVVRIADLDRDGDADIVALNAVSESLFFYPGNGDGTFGPPTSLTVPGAEDFVLADLNGDSNLDYVAALANLDSVEFRAGNGDGTFGSASSFEVGSAPIRVLAADVTGDGQVDIVSANSRSQDVSVIAGNGDGTFRSARSYVADAEPRRLGLGDFNNDGRVDIAVVSEGSSGATVAVLRAREDGTFDAAEDRRVGAAPTDLATGDVDGDGWADLIGVTEPGDIFVFPGRPGIGLGDRRIIPLGGSARGIAVADFDKDLRLDAVVSDIDAGQLVILFGSPSGSLEIETRIDAGGDTPSPVAIGDFNGDGRADIATAQVETSQVAAFLQSGNRRFGSAILSATTLTGQRATPIELAVLDADCDGLDDLIAANNAIDAVAVMLSNGDGTFRIGSELEAAIAGELPDALVVGDFGGGEPLDMMADGRVDFAVGNGRSAGSSNSIRFFFGRCDGTFTPGGGLRAGFLISAMTARDFTGDQIVDLGAVNQTSNVVRSFIGRGEDGNGNGTFSSRPGDTVSRMPETMTAGDYDGDGRYDLAAGNTDASANNVTILTNCVRDMGCDVFNQFLPDGEPAVRGDGNNDGILSAGDIAAVAAERVDGDGSAVEDIERGSFGAAAGVDANGDGRVDPMDIGSLARRIFSGAS